MKRSALLCLLILIAIFNDLFAANKYAVANGNWTSISTWSDSPNGSPGASIPSSNDNVYTNGFTVTINAQSQSCTNLFVEYNHVYGLKFVRAYTLTIHGTLSGWNSELGITAIPTVDVTDNIGILNFTGSSVGSNYTPYVIYDWSPVTTDSKSFIFNFPASNTFKLKSGIRSSNGGIIQIKTGNLTLDPGVELRSSGNTSLNINFGSTLNTESPIQGTSSSLSFESVILSGNLITSSYVNANSFILETKSVFETYFSGADNTEGWWYQNSQPEVITTGINSSVRFLADQPQIIPQANYFNLVVSASTGTKTKTLTGAGTTQVNGTLTINSNCHFIANSILNLKGKVVNNGTWTCNNSVYFSGSALQTVDGNGAIFNSNWTIENLLGVNFNIPVDCNGELAISENSILTTSKDVSLSGNLIQNGKLDVTAGSFNFDGSSSISGNPVSTSFHTLVISGTLNSHPGTIYLKQDFTNNGVFIHNNGTMFFGSANVQNIGGTTVTDFYNITINKTSLAKNVGLSSAARLIGTLTLSSGFSSFKTNGHSFTLVSTAASTARVAAVPDGATVIGNVTVQRFIPQSGRHYRDLSSPVQNATVSQWQAGAPSNGVYITGPFIGADNPGNGLTEKVSSMYTYTAHTGIFSRYPTSSNSEPLRPTFGYRVYVRDGGASYNDGITSAKTISVTGTINQNTQTFMLGYTASGGDPAGGWNLKGNPFPSDITADLSNSAWIHSGLDGTAVAIWKENGYVYCNNGVGDCIIPSGQGFMVRTAGPGATLQATEYVKVNSSHPLYRKSSTPNFMTIALHNPESGISDKTYIRFTSDATKGFDGQYDAYKILTPIGDEEGFPILLSSTLNDNFLAINARPQIENEDTIGLNLSAPYGKNVLTLEQIQGFDQDLEILLFDRFSNKYIPIQETFLYEFYITEDKGSSGNRFSIIYRKRETNVEESPKSSVVNIYPNPIAGNSFTVLIPYVESKQIEVSVYDIFGKPIQHQSFENSDDDTFEEQITLPSDKIRPGMYTVLIKTEKTIFNKHLIIR